jgi:hypothetical protein
VRLRRTRDWHSRTLCCIQKILPVNTCVCYSTTNLKHGEGLFNCRTLTAVPRERPKRLNVMSGCSSELTRNQHSRTLWRPRNKCLIDTCPYHSTTFSKHGGNLSVLRVPSPRSLDPPHNRERSERFEIMGASLRFTGDQHSRTLWLDKQEVLIDISHVFEKGSAYLDVTRAVHINSIQTIR